MLSNHASALIIKKLCVWYKKHNWHCTESGCIFSAIGLNQISSKMLGLESNGKFAL